MPYGTDGGKELVDVEGVELRLEELGSQDVLVAEGRGTEVEHGVAAHVCQAWLPSGDEGVELHGLQSHLLQEKRILGIPLLLLEHEEAVKALVDLQRDGSYLLYQLRVHLLLVVLEPVILAQIDTGGIADTRHALVVGGTAHVGWTTTEGRKESGLQLLATVVLHLLHEGVDGITTRHRLRLVAGHQLKVRPISENHAVLGIRHRVARAAEMGRKGALSHHVVDAVFQHRACLSVHHHLSGEVCLYVWPHVGHQCHVALVNEEGDLPRHVVGDTDQAWTRDALGLAHGTCALDIEHVGVDDVGKQLHRVHVVALEVTQLGIIQYEITHRSPPPAFPLPRCRHREANVSSPRSR